MRSAVREDTGGPLLTGAAAAGSAPASREAGPSAARRRWAKARRLLDVWRSVNKAFERAIQEAQRVQRAHFQRVPVAFVLFVLAGSASCVGLGWWGSSAFSGWERGAWMAATLLAGLWMTSRLLSLGLALCILWTEWCPARYEERYRWHVIARDRQSVSPRYVHDLLDVLSLWSLWHLLQWAVVLGAGSGASGATLALTVFFAAHALIGAWFLGAVAGWWGGGVPRWWPGRGDLARWTLQLDALPGAPVPGGCVLGGDRVRIAKHWVRGELRDGVRAPGGTWSVRFDAPVPADQVETAFAHTAEADGPLAEATAVRIYFDDRLVLDKTLAGAIPGWNDHTRLASAYSAEASPLVRAIRFETTGRDRVVWGVPRVARPVREPRAIIVIVLDGIRPDMIGAYSGRPNDTPFIDQFFADGTRYLHAFSQGNWTKSAFASMATGLYPSQHQVADRWYDCGRLPDAGRLLSETMQRQGFFTGAVMSHFLASQHFGHARGYDQFICHNGQQVDGHVHRDVTWRAIQTFEQHPQEPVFLFLHYFDVHAPFHLDTPYVLPGTAFLSRLYRDLWEYAERGVLDQMQIFRTLYANVLREVDLGLSELFGYLEHTGRADRTAVLLTADHGVNVPTESGMTRERKKDISGSAQQVPLLLRCPWRPETASQVVEGFVEASIDLYPTILALAGHDEAAPSPFARSVLPDREGRWPHKPCVVSEGIFGGIHQVLLCDRTFQYLRRFSLRDGRCSEEIRDRITGALLDAPSDERGRRFGGYRQLAAERQLLQWEATHGA